MLKQRGFLGLLSSQFFGAMNDNILKGALTFMVIDGAWKGRLGDGGQGVVGMCLTVPFILLSGVAGQITDMFSKRKVVLWVKVAEIPIALIGAVGFYTGNLWITMAALIALACQSSFFGPAKYGMIPELVDEGDLSRANGVINMLTNLAVIVGMIAAGWVADQYSPQDGSAGQLWMPGAAMTGVAFLGLAAACFLTRVPAGDPNLKMNWNPFATYLETVKEANKTRLFMVMMAWGYFYLLAGIALFILPEYTVVLEIDRTQASILMAMMGIAVGIGCAVAGYISGHHIETRLVPIGAAGMVVFFLLLAVVPPSLPVPAAEAKLHHVAMSNVAGFIFGTGFFAGFYIVPLQALLQQMSPDDERGRFLGTANAISFVFLTIAAGIYALIRSAFGENPHHIFAICSGLMAAGAGYFLWRLRGTGILVGTRPES